MADEMSASEKKKEDWMNSKWRPAMGWLYMFVCLFDFVIAPILWSVLQSVSKGQVNAQWVPLTLQGAGLFHVAMGAVLGLAAYGRTQEKIAGANNGGAVSSPNLGGGAATGYGVSYTPPPPVPQPVATPDTAAPTVTTPPAPTVTVTSPGVISGFGGKKAPPPQDDPPI
jgi:Holin of 3TMs, for gene-transfer release